MGGYTFDFYMIGTSGVEDGLACETIAAELYGVVPFVE